VADEMLRVARSGGTIGMINFVPEGVAGEFFELFARHAPPPPPGAKPPIMWGSEEHVRELFGDRVSSLELTRGENVERAASPAEYRDFFAETFGPLIALRGSLDRDRVAALDRDFLAFATDANRGEPGGPAEYPYGYLLVVARKA
jgi:hypothetical protein